MGHKDKWESINNEGSEMRSAWATFKRSKENEYKQQHVCVISVT